MQAAQAVPRMVISENFHGKENGVTYFQSIFLILDLLFVPEYTSDMVRCRTDCF
jgi:hypothetical protein